MYQGCIRLGRGGVGTHATIPVCSENVTCLILFWVGGGEQGGGVASTLQVSLLFLTYHEILTSERWSRVQNNIYTYLNINQKKTKSATICYRDKPTPCGDC